MSRYHTVMVEFVMRDCGSSANAVTELARFLPKNPDVSTTHMESWQVDSIESYDEKFDRTTGEREEELEELVKASEAKL